MNWLMVLIHLMVVICINDHFFRQAKNRNHKNSLQMELKNELKHEIDSLLTTYNIDGGTGRK